MIVIRLTNEELTVFKKVLHEAQDELHGLILRTDHKPLKNAYREEARIMNRVGKKLDAIPPHRHAPRERQDELAEILPL